MTQLYTASRLRVWRECPRKHDYRYRLGIRTPATPPMAFGTNTHEALEAWYRAWQAGEDRLGAAYAVTDAAAVDEVDRAKLHALCAAYDLRWGGEPWEVLAVEQEFRYYLGTVEIGGKIDAIIRDRATGKVYVVEHKTSSADTSPGSSYWDRLCIDTQVSIYIDGAAMLGYEVAGCIYDVIKRPQHELLLATPEADRQYTKGKGCKLCGGKVADGVQGSGKSKATSDGVCHGCDGTGWRLDQHGQPEAPRLYAKQRDRDETIEEYEQRVAGEIGERVDEFLSRGVVVRLDSELPRMRQELLDTITAMRTLDELGIAPPNHDACVRGRGEPCPFFAACSGRADIHDQHVFPRGGAHPELASAA